MSEPVKLMMTWDIKPGQEKVYFSFITQEFPTVLRQAGLELTDAWYTMYGTWPQVSMGFVSEDLPTLETFLMSERWLRVKHRLLGYVQGYHQRVIPAQGWFQILRITEYSDFSADVQPVPADVAHLRGFSFPRERNLYLFLLDDGVQPQVDFDNAPVLHFGPPFGADGGT